MIRLLVVLASMVSPAVAGAEPLLSPRAVEAAHRGWLVAQGNYDVIRTKDGKVRVGKILREVQRGFLFRDSNGETVLIEYEQVDDVQSTQPVSPGGSRPPSEVPPQPAAPPSPATPPPAASAAPPVVPSTQPSATGWADGRSLQRRRELEAELTDLKAQPRVSAIPDIVLMAFGGPLALIVGFIAVFTEKNGLVLGGAMLVLAFVFEAAGVGHLIYRLVKNGYTSNRIEEAERELRTLPPSARRLTPPQGLVLASF